LEIQIRVIYHNWQSLVFSALYPPPIRALKQTEKAERAGIPSRMMMQQRIQWRAAKIVPGELLAYFPPFPAAGISRMKRQMLSEEINVICKCNALG
jgi:hypothetical protein